MEIVMAKKEDIEEIVNVYAVARQFMKDTGNPTQWGNDKPSRDTLMDDIDKSQLYVVMKDGIIHACFVFFIGEEKTYRVIEEGEWKSDSRYGVIHRVASDQKERGILPLILSYCASRIPHLRIDTHRDNKVMQHLLKKNGFSSRGIIHLEDGDERLAFERIQES